MFTKKGVTKRDSPVDLELSLYFCFFGGITQYTGKVTYNKVKTVIHKFIITKRVTQYLSSHDYVLPQIGQYPDLAILIFHLDLLCSQKRS